MTASGKPCKTPMIYIQLSPHERPSERPYQLSVVIPPFAWMIDPYIIISPVISHTPGFVQGDS